jgi:cold shock CspA family protein
MNSDRRQGVVSGYDLVKKFGFIVPDTEAVGLFVGGHALRTSGNAALRKGDRIAFTIATARNGRPECVALELLTPRGS